MNSAVRAGWRAVQNSFSSKSLLSASISRSSGRNNVLTMAAGLQNKRSSGGRRGVRLGSCRNAEYRSNAGNCQRHLRFQVPGPGNLPSIGPATYHRPMQTPLRIVPLFILSAWASGLLPIASSGAEPAAPAPAGAKLFARDNLMAWCIVPFDSRKRTPEERAVMLEKLGFKHFAYDWRAEHIPTFDAEIAALKKHGVALDAWWFPTELNGEARQILDALKRNG